MLSSVSSSFGYFGGEAVLGLSDFMSFGGFLDITDTSCNAMMLSNDVFSQQQQQAFTKSIFNSPALSLALVSNLFSSLDVFLVLCCHYFWLMFKSLMFVSWSMFLLQQTGLEGQGEAQRIRESFVTSGGVSGVGVGSRRSREEDHESRSGSDNLEGGSGEDLDAPDINPSQKKKKYHRHTPQQIQELEA